MSFLAKTFSSSTNLYVRTLIEQGAIPIAKSNISQASLFAHSVNGIYGLALNPHDQERSCGGSSGGEAGLQAAQCSLFGLGGDIGGSIRIPSSFCGVRGIKLTSNRVTLQGLKLPMGNTVMDQIKPGVGVISGSMEVVVEVARTMMGAQV
mmetsp:Transcript_30804/g.22904  ORF Transcript_30804/g.22904 Transcript_30804/m.22904 type:complete len:150 (+) Transcript_30804:490-939(+)